MPYGVRDFLTADEIELHDVQLHFSRNKHRRRDALLAAVAQVGHGTLNVVAVIDTGHVNHLASLPNRTEHRGVAYAQVEATVSSPDVALQHVRKLSSGLECSHLAVGGGAMDFASLIRNQLLTAHDRFRNCALRGVQRFPALTLRSEEAGGTIDIVVLSHGSCPSC